MKYLRFFFVVNHVAVSHECSSFIAASCNKTRSPALWFLFLVLRNFDFAVKFSFFFFGFLPFFFGGGVALQPENMRFCFFFFYVSMPMCELFFFFFFFFLCFRKNGLLHRRESKDSLVASVFRALHAFSALFVGFPLF